MSRKDHKRTGMEGYQPGQRLKAWVHPGAETRESPMGGQGLFACQFIPAGEVVLRWGGVVYRREEILAGKANPESIAVLAEDLYLADPADELLPEDYPLNHSCDPNLWMADAVTLTARRDIAPDEELTADYALWLYDMDWVLEPCHCGSRLCRGRVSGADWTLPELQARYAGHFTPWINGLIERCSS